MSTTRAHQHAHLRQLRDPTETESIRKRFLRAVRRRFRAVRGVLRAAVGYDQDVLGLAAGAQLGADDVERFPGEGATVAQFLAWFRAQLRAAVLDPEARQAIREGDHWTAPYIRNAYAQGWQQATNRLRVRGVGVGEELGLDAIIQLPTPRRQLRRLYRRNFDALRSITSDAVPVVREELTRGLAEGVNPREMARRLTKEVRTLQRTRAEVLAWTEVINSHADATLDRYERAGVDGVTVSGEFATADDERVCPICEAIEGEVYGIEEFRTATFTFDPGDGEPDHLAGEYPVKPPVHPQCRCAILPVIG